MVLQSGDRIKLKPCIPKEWKEYKIRYEYGSSIYNIYVKNPNESDSNEVAEIIVDGQKVEEKQIKLIDNGRIYEIEVLIK